MTNQDVHRHLIEGLVGDRHRDKWHHSPTFKAAVETLAGMLPAMVDGLARESEQQDARVRQMEHLFSQQVVDETTLRLAMVTTHVRESTPLGPDYCGPCSQAIGDWVPWPCKGSLGEEPSGG